MSVDFDELSRADRARHREDAAGFWAVSLLLTLALLVAFPPTKALGTTAGVAIAAALALATIAYIVRLHRLGAAIPEPELFAAGVASALAVGVDQWLSGGFATPLYVMFTLHVLGAAAGLSSRRLRTAHVGVVSLAVAAPLAYDTFTAQWVVFVLVLIALLFLEAALLGDFGDRLRAQRRALAEAERDASTRARTDALTGLGNRRALTADVAAVADGQRPATVVYLDLDGFKGYNDRFGHTAGDALLRRLAGALEACVGERGRAFRLGGDEFCVVFDGAVEDALVEACVGALTEQGPGFAIGPSRGVVVMPRDADDLETALRLADERMYAFKRSGRPSPAEEMSRLLLSVLAERAPALFEHTNEVTRLAVAVAARLELSDGEAEAVGQAAALHDIGQVAIPDAILQKPGALDESELSLLREQTAIAERILATTPSLQAARRLVRASHERWDGTGFPDGLSGDEIPLGARIVSACDAYVAMRHPRADRPAMRPADALTELAAGAGTRFDPDVVRAVAVETGSIAGSIAVAAASA